MWLQTWVVLNYLTLSAIRFLVENLWMCTCATFCCYVDLVIETWVSRKSIGFFLFDSTISTHTFTMYHKLDRGYDGLLIFLVIGSTAFKGVMLSFLLYLLIGESWTWILQVSNVLCFCGTIRWWSICFMTLFIFCLPQSWTSDDCADQWHHDCLHYMFIFWRIMVILWLEVLNSLYWVLFLFFPFYTFFVLLGLASPKEKEGQ